MPARYRYQCRNPTAKLAYAQMQINNPSGRAEIYQRV